jgi:hypothetical protein
MQYERSQEDLQLISGRVKEVETKLRQLEVRDNEV